MKRCLAALAARAPVPMFAAIGTGAVHRIDDLSLDPGVRLVASARHANVLLIAGDVRTVDEDALRRVHDQLPHPRATLCWGGRAIDGLAPASSVGGDDDPLPALGALYRDILSGARPSEPDLLPDEPPAPWRGVGPNGQGGEGMMGGKPYGRAMAMTTDDLRDGLALDAFGASIGPFFCALPPGLVLDLVLQGDVIQRAAAVRAPLVSTSAPPAAQRLRLLARLLTLLGLRPLARRCRDSARRIDAGAVVDLVALRRSVERTGALAALPPGLAIVDGVDARERMRRWLRGEEAPEGAPIDLATLLPGLEWHEALLAVASLDPRSLEPSPAAGDEHAAHARHHHGHTM